MIRLLSQDKVHFMDALILCGGFAKRLEPITLFIPKPLLPIGGKPILDYIVDDLAGLEIDRIVISSNQKFKDQFSNWIGKKKREINKPLELVVEPTLHNGNKLGAIGGIRYAVEKAGLKDDLLVIAGDNFYDFSILEMLKHFNKTREATVGVHDIGSLEEAKRFGVVEVKNGVIRSFIEKPDRPTSTLISTVIYMLPKTMLNKFDEYLDASNNPDAPGYFIQWLVKNNGVGAFVYRGRWFDIGTVETYEKVSSMFQKEDSQ